MLRRPTSRDAIVLFDVDPEGLAWPARATVSSRPPTDPVARLLAAIRDGDAEAWDELFARIYDDLHRLALRHRRGERRDHTLQTTALVNEAYLRLGQERERSFVDRAHFLAVASMAMRRVLVDYAEQRAALKRGGGRERLAIEDAVGLYETPAQDLGALDKALERLRQEDELKARVVELRFFGGLTVAEIAEVLGVSSRTVDRTWRYARAWLRARMSEGG